MLKMESTLPFSMTGPCYLSWPCQMELMRECWIESRLVTLAHDLIRATEDFSYFTLRYNDGSKGRASSLFGISCTRQMDANTLINRPADVTRSTVQKAVVVIADSPASFGHVREKLSMVTNAWFAQRWGLRTG